MGIFHSERARIEIQSFHQIARTLYHLGGTEGIIVGYTTARFAAEKAIKYLLYQINPICSARSLCLAMLT